MIETDMELRDYFASHALIGLLSKENWEGEDIRHYAQASYQLADALLKERNNSDT